MQTRLDRRVPPGLAPLRCGRGYPAVRRRPQVLPARPGHQHRVQQRDRRPALPPAPLNRQPTCTTSGNQASATTCPRGFNAPTQTNQRNNSIIRRDRPLLRGALPPARCRHILDRATHRPHRPPREHSRSSRRRPQHCCPSSSSEHPRSVTDRWINKSRAVGHSAKVSGRRTRVSQRAHRLCS